MANDSNNMQDTHDKYTKAYIDILNTYKIQISSSIEEKKKLKEKFFNVIKNVMYWLIFVFIITIIFSIILFGIMAYKNYDSIAVVTGAIATIISSFSTMIVSIFKLPKIVAEYLFNKEEDKSMDGIIKNIQQYEINAVKYELDKMNIEKIKQLTPEASITLDETNDIDLMSSTYNTPSQSMENQASEIQIENSDEENNAS